MENTDNQMINLKSIFDGLITPRNGLPMDIKSIYNSINAQDSAFQFILTSLSRIEQILTTQIFYEVRPSDYMDVRVGEGQYMEEIIRNTISYPTGSFFGADIDDGNAARQAEADISIEQIRRPVQTWSAAIQYTIIDVYRAIASQNIDIIEQKLRSRQKLWQLGIQELAFLGHPVKSGYPGLYTATNVNIDTAVITKSISSMSDTEFQGFIADLLPAYYANSNSTRLPNRFVVPRSDFLGFGTASSSGFPINTKWEYMMNTLPRLAAADGGTDFQIKSTIYGEQSQMSTRGIDTNRYLLYHQDPETLMLNIPLDYVTTQFNTLDNFNFQNVAYGQYTGTTIFRPLEVLYFDYPNA